MKLSIIIPVYQVESTLNHCLESVISQSMTDFELILVDDGSPDRCPQLCDEWATKDSRISVIHKPNGGLSDARNAGIEKAKGEYLTFIDSDDFIGEETFAPLINMMRQQPEIDILEYPVYVFFNSKRQHILTFSNEHYTNMADYWYKGCAYQHTYAWNKIYRRKLFEHIRFPVGQVFEDVQTLPKILKETKMVVTTNIGIYYYCANPSGITATANGDALRMLLKPHIEIIKQTERNDYWFQRYYMHVLNIQMDVYEQTGVSPILPEMAIDPTHFSGIQKIKALALNHLGLSKLCIINTIFHKIWRNR